MNKAIKAVILVLLFAAGPGMLVGWGFLLKSRSANMSGRASAEVIRIAEYSGSNHSRSYCPVYAFVHGDERYQVESGSCGNSESDYQVGQLVDVRFDESDPGDAVYADTFGAVYGQTFPMLLGGVVMTALFLFIAWPAKKKPVSRPSR